MSPCRSPCPTGHHISTNANASHLPTPLPCSCHTQCSQRAVRPDRGHGPDVGNQDAMAGGKS